MNNVERFKLLEKLRWKGASAWLQATIKNKNGTDLNKMGPMEFLDNLLEAEDSHKEQRTQELLLKNAHLPRRIIPADVQCSAANGLSKEKWAYLCECNFIESKTGIIITGKTGVGKTYTASALAYQACSLQKSTLFYNMTRLQSDINDAKLQGTYYKLIKQLTKVSLLIVDDFALIPIAEQVLISLYEIMEARSGISSTIFTSQLPFNNWYNLLNANLNIGEAFLDRIKGCSESIELKGKSKRTFKTACTN